MVLLYYANDRDPAPWIDALKAAGSEFEIRQWPDTGPRDEIDYALLWNPPQELFQGLSNLKVVFSLGAGVDQLLQTPDLPLGLPLVRVAEPDLTNRMSEYVVLQVLMHHRRQRAYDESQGRREWRPLPQRAAAQVRVGVMGLGVLGGDAATKLRTLGFQVAGWSRTARNMEGIDCFAGDSGLVPFLNRSEILVCLLPVTAYTRGILKRSLFEELAAGETGAVLINAGRGALQVEEDILAALETGTLRAATLDTFVREPLPPESRLWSHPGITVTPHIAATSDPGAIAATVIEQIRRFESGGNLENLVDRDRGY